MRIRQETRYTNKKLKVQIFFSSSRITKGANRYPHVLRSEWLLISRGEIVFFRSILVSS